MKFGDVFDKSLVEYKSSFKQIFLAIIFLTVIPSFLVILYQTLFASFSSDVLNSVVSPLSNPFLDPNLSPAFLVYLISLFFFGLVLIILSLIYSAGLISSLFKSKKVTYQSIFTLGKKNFWRYLAFVIVFGFFMLLLFLALIIPAIIFFVFWSLALFVYFNEDVGIIESLRRSFRLVKGRWWLTFGRLILLLLLLIIIYFVLTIPLSLINFVIVLAGGNGSLLYFVFSGIIGLISGIVSSLVGAFSIFFLKNMYLSYKKEKR